MPKIKELPKVDRPREKLISKGVDSLSKSDLLAILLGSGIKGVNVRELANTIIKKFNTNFLNLTIDDLLTIKGIGRIKAVQIIASINLIKRFYEENNNDLIIKNSQIVLTLTHDLINKKKEYLVCLYLDSRNKLIHKENISIGLLDKSLVHPREIFTDALKYSSANIILVHNHPSGNPTPSKQDKEVVKNIAKAGNIMGIPLLDFIVIAKNGSYSFFEELKNDNNIDYIADYQLNIFHSLQDKNKKYQHKEQKIKFKFIDLFAGIGGFHLAASNLGGECVFASEIDEQARKIYELNFIDHNPELFYSNNFVGDITKVKEQDIPKFDFLFAGFPCQPFSKGGYRKGFEDTRGTLFFDIARIIKFHKPKFILLENVQNLASHDSGRTFDVISNTLEELGYALHFNPLILSPDDFGIPAIRKRIFIPAIKKGIIKSDKFDLDFSKYLKSVKNNQIYEIIEDDKINRKFYINDYEKKVLEVWNEFYLNIDLKIIGFPIWAEEFKKEHDISSLPIWKSNFIIKNRELYARNKNFIDKWLLKYNNLEWIKPTHKKMEWQAGKDIDNIYEGLIQFRPSGIRVKRPNKFSTLVAMNHSQIIGKYKRRITPNETKKLQSFPNDFILPKQDNIALKQLGNSVNVLVVEKIIKQIINYGN
jgi:DNA (cytosine-5)-methyltransferase 1